MAASRAKDQVWLVHSLNCETDLKKGDLRRRLIEHLLNPSAASSRLAESERNADSEFEREVIRRLSSAGYLVQSQKQVGYFKIDIVVEGGGRCLAVECDGDRYHTLDNLAADMERQAILERLGWKFVRIRGSEFFRDPDRAMIPVFERLGKLGVAKSSDAGREIQRKFALVEEILRRADQIGSAWESENGEPVVGGLAGAAFA